MSATYTFRDMINANNWVILDTETTGLRRPAEIIEIAVIDFLGNTLIDTRLKNAMPIPREAINIHGIEEAMLTGMPEWTVFRPSLIEAIRGKDMIVYNATYDRHMMHCTDEAWRLPKMNYHEFADWHCAMLWYADYYGAYDGYHSDPKWQKLTDAALQQGVSMEGIKPHSALGDCQLTRRVIMEVMRKIATADILASIPFDPPFTTTTNDDVMGYRHGDE
jgi:DNA polymerase-3 subunit epsilon